jgi:hypothetical protein
MARPLVFLELLIMLLIRKFHTIADLLCSEIAGVGAGQQSRVDCVKLAGRKAESFYLRQHPKVLALPFKPTTKRQERVNARVRYIEGSCIV